MKRVLVAMSGGVDSSVAAWLLREQGYACIGVTMKLFDNPDVGIPREHSCCSLDDVEDARSVARRLGIPHYVFNFSRHFRSQVMDRFAAAYLRGETPNPCIDCNRFIKFDLLLRRALELGCDFIATGHYVRAERETQGRFLLKKGIDPAKDQSYVLYAMTQEQLGHTLFPLGGMSKSQVRAIAEREGFINARKSDSQDICFVPDGDYPAFLELYTDTQLPPGRLVGLDGETLGTARGNAAAYTIGQRRGLGFPASRRLYVCAKNTADNTVTLGPEETLYTDEADARDWNWIIAPPTEPIRAQVRLRYHQSEQPAVLYPQNDGTVHLHFLQPVRAAAPGQAAVAYDGDLVLGGGTLI